MPYMITTKRETSNPEFGAPGESRTAYDVSRRAVATLEEAKRAARTPIDAARAEFAMGPNVWGRLRRQVFDLSESGGTVGPLPDGTMIEVERLSPLMLASRLPSFSAEDLLTCKRADDFGPLITAYNAREQTTT